MPELDTLRSGARALISPPLAPAPLAPTTPGPDAPASGIPAGPKA